MFKIGDVVRVNQKNSAHNNKLAFIVEYNQDLLYRYKIEFIRNSKIYFWANKESLILVSKLETKLFELSQIENE